MPHPFDEHVAALTAHKDQARAAVMAWAQEHAPDATVRDLSELLEQIARAVGDGMTASYTIGCEMGRRLDAAKAA